MEYTPAPGNLSSNYERIVRSAVRNAEKIAGTVGLEPRQLSVKLAEIYEEYGVALLHERRLGPARECLGQALKHQPSGRTVVRWMTTFAPRSLLDLRRNLTRSLSQFLS